MNFDLSNPHTLYVLAAYGIALTAYGALAIHTVLKWRKVTKELRK